MKSRKEVEDKIFELIGAQRKCTHNMINSTNEKERRMWELMLHGYNSSQYILEWSMIESGDAA